MVGLKISDKSFISSSILGKITEREREKERANQGNFPLF
jgi:hypothetical protein